MLQVIDHGNGAFSRGKSNSPLRYNNVIYGEKGRLKIVNLPPKYNHSPEKSVVRFIIEFK